MLSSSIQWHLKKYRAVVVVLAAVAVVVVLAAVVAVAVDVVVVVVVCSTEIDAEKRLCAVLQRLLNWKETIPIEFLLAKAGRRHRNERKYLFSFLVFLSLSHSVCLSLSLVSTFHFSWEFSLTFPMMIFFLGRF